MHNGRHYHRLIQLWRIIQQIFARQNAAAAYAIPPLRLAPGGFHTAKGALQGGFCLLHGRLLLKQRYQPLNAEAGKRQGQRQQNGGNTRRVQE